MTDLQGAVLDHYQLTEELGAGGMGSVWAAEALDGRDHPPVAIKVIHPELASAPEFHERFLREAELGRRVEHPHVVRTLGVGRAEIDAREVHFLVMERVEGRTLHALSQSLGPLPDALCRQVALQAARGLHAIHQAGAIHRDIKPENLIIDARRTIKIMDLGIAMVADESTRLTQTGAFVGSLRYAAPEQLMGDGRDVDARVDLHALGLVLHELVTGKPTFDGDMAQVAWQVVAKEPPRASTLNPSVSPFLDEVIHTLLAKDRSARFADAPALVEAIEQGEGSAWWHQVNRLRRDLRHQARVADSAPLAGRTEELAQLLQRARTAGGCMVSGPAGIGKSRLLDALVHELGGPEGPTVLRAGYHPDGGPSAVRQALAGYLADLGTTTELARLLPAARPVAEALAEWVEGTVGANLTPTTLRDALTLVLDAMAAEHPVVILLEDVHLAPPEDVQLLSGLARDPQEAIAVVATTRPAPVVAELTEQGWAHIALAPLESHAVVALVRAVHPTADTSLQEHIVELAEGNPYFVFELLRTLRGAAEARAHPARTWVPDSEVADLPRSIREVLAARLARLDPTDRSLLELAAVDGYHFSDEMLAAARGEPLVDVLERLAHIERDHLLVRAVGDGFRFDHHRLHEVVLNELAASRRQSLHRQLAEAYEALDAPTGDEVVRLVSHWLACGRAEAALPHVERAQEHLVGKLQLAAGLDLLDRVLAHGDAVTGVTRASLLLRKSRAMHLHLGQQDDELRTSLAEALALAQEEGDAELEVHVRIQLSKHQEHTGRNRQAFEALAPVIGKLDSLEPELASQAAATLAWACMSRGDYQEAESLLTRAVDLAASIDNRLLLACQLSDRGDCRVRTGRLDEAEADLRQARELLDTIGDRSRLGAVVANMARVSWARGDFHEAERWLRARLDLARETGHRRGEGQALTNLGMILGTQGRYAEAIEVAERRLRLIDERADPLGTGQASETLGSLHQDQGKLAAARTHYERMLVIAERVGSPFLLAAGHHRLAGTEILLGAWRSVRRRAETGRDAAAACRAPTLPMLYLRLDVELARHRGDLAAAQATLHEIIDGFERMRRPQAIAAARSDLAEVYVAAGRVVEARALAHQVLAVPQLRGDLELRNQVLLATLPDGDRTVAEASWDRLRATVPWATRWKAAHTLFRATDDDRWLEEAHALLEHLREHAPPASRNLLLAAVPAYQEVALAWAELRGF